MSRRISPQDDAVKAMKIVTAGGSTMFEGDPRHLRRIQSALADEPGIETFLGDDDDDQVVLVVQAAAPVGSMYMEHVPS